MLSYLYPVNSKLGRILKHSCEYVLNYRYVFIFKIFFLSTAGRSIRHSGGCDGERILTLCLKLSEGNTNTLCHHRNKVQSKYLTIIFISITHGIVKPPELN